MNVADITASEQADRDRRDGLLRKILTMRLRATEARAAAQQIGEHLAFVNRCLQDSRLHLEKMQAELQGVRNQGDGLDSREMTHREIAKATETIRLIELVRSELLKRQDEFHEAAQGHGRSAEAMLTAAGTELRNWNITNVIP
jgi:hypothetical protein